MGFSSKPDESPSTNGDSDITRSHRGSAGTKSPLFAPAFPALMFEVAWIVHPDENTAELFDCPFPEGIEASRSWQCASCSFVAWCLLRNRQQSINRRTRAKINKTTCQTWCRADLDVAKHMVLASDQTNRWLVPYFQPNHTDWLSRFLIVDGNRCKMQTEHILYN